MDRPDIGASPINEYNTEGQIDMVFPTLFPIGDVDWLYPRLYNVQMHEYGLHLLIFYDQRFRSHPQFWYFLLNMIMQHRSQGTTWFFFKKNINENVPATIRALRQQLYDFLNNKSAEKVMHFGSCLRGTRAYWTKSCSELIDMTNHLGWPTLSFTSIATDTKWPDLHSLMPSITGCHQQEEQAKKIQNVIWYLHIVAMHMHQIFNIFCDTVLQRHLGTKDFWYRFVVVLFWQFYNDLKEKYMLL